VNDFLIKDGQKVVMQGDSITDAGRRAEAAPYGQGYAAIFREMVTALYPERSITFLNKGIGGNKTTDLKERWDDDVIRHQPDWLTLMIGINDLHTYLRAPDDPEAVPLERYREIYDWLMARTRAQTQADIVLIDPFYISISSRDNFRRRVLEIIPDYIAVVHEMAEKYDAMLVEMNDIFANCLKYVESETFCLEPVHPARGGHIAIALALLRTLQGI